MRSARNTITPAREAQEVQKILGSSCERGLSNHGNGPRGRSSLRNPFASGTFSYGSIAEERFKPVQAVPSRAAFEQRSFGAEKAVVSFQNLERAVFLQVFQEGVMARTEAAEH